MFCKQNWKNRFFITGHSKGKHFATVKYTSTSFASRLLIRSPIHNQCFIKLSKGASIIAYLIIAWSLALVVFGKRQEGFLYVSAGEEFKTPQISRESDTVLVFIFKST